MLTPDAVKVAEGDQKTARELEITGQSYAARIIPVADFAGNTAGLVHVMVPPSAYLAIAGQMRLLAIGGGAVALLAGLGFAVVFSGQISKTLLRMIAKMRRLAGGDLDLDFQSDRRIGGEVGQMAEALVHFRESIAEELVLKRERDAAAAHQKAVVDILAEGYDALRRDYNATVASLAELIADISDAAQTINASVAAINGSAHELSQRTENAAATLQETAAALQDLTTSISATAEGARGADAISRDAIGKARSGSQMLGETVRAMGEIDASAGEIARIIHVIDDIAFQTNLLALNAGVEAARAATLAWSPRKCAPLPSAPARRWAPSSRRSRGSQSGSARLPSWPANSRWGWARSTSRPASSTT
ncbi:methyl-accepting chemotaxis protein [Rhodovulum strictum]|uniref:HAMP domain-containing protein n=1 Tax=Rhodovulum strictum TaxID=58314 RepID=A0A844B1P3_9RHOB|nr:HAMP domain-containing methyl-accepting chemotaxis protein [Rhodovulum strictum]MRH20041.1 HAMP domain-containing protein [Rhodovulum strictum]